MRCEVSMPLMAEQARLRWAPIEAARYQASASAGLARQHRSAPGLAEPRTGVDWRPMEPVTRQHLHTQKQDGQREAFCG